MNLTVGELKQLLNMYPDDYPVEIERQYPIIHHTCMKPNN